jgi:hypothetical protein
MWTSEIWSEEFAQFHQKASHFEKALQQLEKLNKNRNFSPVLFKYVVFLWNQSIEPHGADRDQNQILYDVAKEPTDLLRRSFEMFRNDYPQLFGLNAEEYEILEQKLVLRNRN